MELLNEPSRMSDLTNSGKEALVPPQNPIRIPGIESECLLSRGESSPHHRHASSDSLLIEEQPAWLEELLSEPETASSCKGHRRSASDSAAYIKILKNLSLGPLWVSQSIGHRDDLWNCNFSPSLTLRSNSFSEHQFRIWEMPNQKGTRVQRLGSSGSAQEQGVVPSRPMMNQGRDRREAFPAKNNSQQANVAFKSDAKRAKQQNAHRARVRRLQYIAELERNVQMLQAEGAEVSSAIRFFNQENLMLSMENRVLKERLDSLAQVQKLKQLEQYMLEREIGRLQFLYQQQQRQPKPRPQRQTQSKELESQFATVAI